MKKIIFLSIITCIFFSCGKLRDSLQKKGIVSSDIPGQQKKVKDFVDEAIENGYKVDPIEGDIYMMDYPLSYDEGTRFQRVYLRDWYDDVNKRQTYFINSYICDYTPNIDLVDILREAEYGRMSMICLKRVPDDNGGEKEAFYIQTTIPVTFINNDYDEFMEIVFEVAANADYIDKKINHGEDVD